MGLDLVVEAAGCEAVEPWGVPILEEGTPFAVASLSAFTDEARLTRLVEAAERGGASLILPSGSVGGLDALGSAAIRALAEVVHTVAKPPSAWRGTAAEALVSLETLTARTILFRGTAREAARRFPQNANATVATALAGIGLDRTIVELVADPASAENSHTIVAAGDFGRMSMTLVNRPMAANPKTSELTALSLVRVIERFGRPLG